MKDTPFDPLLGAWINAAPDLARFVARNLVVTREAWPAFSPQQGGWIWRTGSLNETIITRHFASPSDNDAIGIVSEAPIPNYHMTVRSHWIGFRIAETEPDAAATAFAVVREITSWGLQPLLEQRVGDAYQIWTLFDRSDPAKYQLVRDGRPMHYAARRLESSDLQCFLAEWMALPGRVPGSDESSRFYNGVSWDTGVDAVRRFMESAVNDGTLLALPTSNEISVSTMPSPPTRRMTDIETAQQSGPVETPQMGCAASDGACEDDSEDALNGFEAEPRDPAAEWRKLSARRRAFLLFDELLPLLLVLFVASVAVLYILQLLKLSYLVPWILLAVIAWVAWRWHRHRT